MHLEISYSRSPVHYATVDDMHLCILKRVGGGPDTKTPRYFLGIGASRDGAKDQALYAAQARLGTNIHIRSV